MSEIEQQAFKARKARLVEGILRHLFGDEKAEARLAEIKRAAAKQMAMGEKGKTDD